MNRLIYQLGFVIHWDMHYNYLATDYNWRLAYENVRKNAGYTR